MQKLARSTRTAHGAALQLAEDIKTRAAQLQEEPEGGFDELPWKMILMVGGVVLAGLLVAWGMTYLNGKLGEIK